jgi:hypothetical protein
LPSQDFISYTPSVYTSNSIRHIKRENKRHMYPLIALHLLAIIKVIRKIKQEEGIEKVRIQLRAKEN